MFKRAWIIWGEKSKEDMAKYFTKVWGKTREVKKGEIKNKDTDFYIEVIHRPKKDVIGRKSGSYKIHYWERLQKFPTSNEKEEYFNSEVKKPAGLRYPFTMRELKIAKDISGKFRHNQISREHCEPSGAYGICPALAIETFKRLGWKGKIVCGNVRDLDRGIIPKSDFYGHCWVEYDGKVYDFNNLSIGAISYRISKVDRRFYRPTIVASSIKEFYEKIKNTDLLPPKRTKLLVGRFDKLYGNDNFFFEDG